MLPTASAAIGLAEIAIKSMQGSDELRLQEPLMVEDRADMWFVKGQGHRDPGEHRLDYNVFYMHAMKDTAEIVNIGIRVRLHFPKDYATQIRANLTPSQIEEAWGEPKVFEKEARDVSMAGLVYGGIINTAPAALAFASMIIKANRPNVSLAAPLQAELADSIWHIHAGRSVHDIAFKDVLIFDRSNARISALNL
jgi:hypothetical protein